MRNSLIRAIGFVAALTAGATAGVAQTAPPTLEKVSPTGAHRGTRVTLEIQGTNIAGATRVIFSEPGLSANVTAVKEIPIEKPMIAKGVVRTDAPIDDKAKNYAVTAVVTIAADVPHGVHAFRISTPLGVSNVLRFAVSALAEISEQEPNEQAAPQKVALPAALVGALATPGDVDAYEFAARAGDEMVFQVVARPLGSRLDSVLRIRNAQGRVVAENNDFDLSRDSILTWRFAEAGTYVLTMEDVEHGGAKNGYVYRIYAGALPFVTATFPLGVAGGSTASITATGVNLGSAAAFSVRGDPASLSGGTIPIVVTTPSGPALNRKVAALGRYPEVLEVEPNDALGAAQRLAIPSTVNGRVWTPAAVGGSDPARIDHDVFRFTARKGQALVFEAAAQQLGSPLDTIIEVLAADGRVVPRAVLRSIAQTEIALNDPDSGRRGMRLAAWNDFAINDYLLVGDELLQVEAMPTHPDDDLRLKGFRGGRTALLDTSARNHSVGAAVYKVEIHPPGAKLEANGMPIAQIDYVNDDGGTRFGGKDSRLHFVAPSDGEYFVRLRDVRGMEGERFAYRLTVREPSPDFDITFDPKSFNVPRGGRVSVTVTATRRDGFDGPIAVELRDLPAGLTATAGLIAGGADTTVLTVEAAERASFEGQKAVLRSMSGREFDVPGFGALKLVARATIDGHPVVREADVTDPISVVALAPAPDLVVTTGAQEIEVTAGQQVALTVTIERHNGFTARVPISVMNLPYGVRVDDIGLNGVMITEHETTRTIHIVVEPWVQAQSLPLLVVGRVEVNSPLRNESAAPPVRLVIKTPVRTVTR